MGIVKSVKKILVTIIIIYILIGIFNKVLATTITLNQLIEKFNSSNPMAEHLEKSYNSNVIASQEDNNIILTHNNCPFTDSKIQKVEFSLDNNVLSTTINKSTTSATAYMSELSMAWMLIDCIGQLNGYEKEQFYETLKGTGENYKNYTLEKEGLEIKILDNSTSIKIDLSKKVPILNEETEKNEDDLKNTEVSSLNGNDNQNINKNEIKNSTNKKDDNITQKTQLPQAGEHSNIIMVIVTVIVILNIIIAFIILNLNKKYKNI